MSKRLTMPDRKDSDGPVAVRRVGENAICIEATTEGQSQAIECSRYNAFRLFGILSVMLEIPLPAKVGKVIKL